MKPAGRVEHENVEALEAGGIERAPGDLDGRLAGNDRKGRDVRLAAEHGELLLSRRPGDVERRHHHLLAVLVGEPLGDLGSGGRLARALKADHHDHRRRSDRDLEPRFLGAEHLDERVMDDLDDLLAGGDRAQHLLADRFLRGSVDELADDREGDVGLEQGDSDLAHRRAHVGLGQRAAAAQPVEHTVEAIAQALEHSSLQRRQTKNAGGRNLAGQRASLDASKLTRRRDGRHIGNRCPAGKGVGAGRASARSFHLGGTIPRCARQ